jgi:selenide,water dikinase
MQTPGPRELVLVGAGHAHVQVLRRWMMKPLPGVRLTVVVDRPEAVYSGMVPGFVSEDYAAPELEIDAVPLARRAGARLVLAAATRVDPDARHIELEGRPALHYDVASLDVGSTVRGLELPGVRQHALPTRPIRGFVDRLAGEIARAREARGEAPLRIAIVGGGAAGVELAFTLGFRLRRAAVRFELALLAASPELLPGHPPRVARRLARHMAAEGIRLHTGFEVAAVEKDAVRGETAGAPHTLPADLVVWAAGAAPTPFVQASSLPRSEAGFVRVRETLQVADHDALFAAGDCAVLDAHPWMPRAGVHAVREGPVLDRNLRAFLVGARLQRHRPQRDFLMLLNLGGGRAFGAKWGIAAEGRAVFRLKDAIDRRFMRRFQVLDAGGAPASAFPSAETMGMSADPMACGGCAAKIGARPLAEALLRLPDAPLDPSVLRGLDAPDDAALLDAGAGRVTLATIDGFRPFTDDPWLVGRVAAVNAVSDVLAKGGRPRHALALVTVPEGSAKAEAETLCQVLAGIRAALDPLGVSLVGGHTTKGSELFVGLAITGEADSMRQVLPLEGARQGDVLLLSRPIGTGVVLAADMQGRAKGTWLAATLASMVRPNTSASVLAREHDVRAATDVSGFGLAGHLDELLAASGVAARLRLAAIPLLPGAETLYAAGLRSTAHEQNVQGVALRADRAARDDPRFAALFDPQTSGGLLLAVPADRADRLLESLQLADETEARVIGQVTAPSAPAFDGIRIDVEP